ncbi:MAG: dienelactone hydrolase family protein [Thermoprotei archaeon]
MSIKVRTESLSYAGRAGPIQAYLSRPDVDEPRPAVIVIHEIWGLNNYIRDVADRFAREGYVALAPHLFSSGHVPREMLSEDNIRVTMQFFLSIPPEKQRDLEYARKQLEKLPDDRRRVVQALMGVIFNLPLDKLTDELVAAVEFLKASKFVRSDRIGSIGFCFGGGMSARLGCTGQTDACVIFYGENPSPIENVAKIRGPVLGIYGGLDRRINAGLSELVGAMVKYEKDFEMRIYPGAPHAFFNDTNPTNYREAAAKQAWDQTLRFFARSLRV